jgi:hypothetical protein
VTGDSREQRDVRKRVLHQYLPKWCASPSRPHPLDPKGFFAQDWSFLTPGLAYWFLVAIDENVVDVNHGDFKLGASWSEGIFEQGPKATSPRRTKLRRESFLEIAAVGMLALRYGWPVKRLRFQSPGWAFDFLAYADDAWSEIAVAGEAKRLQKDAVALADSLKVCGMRGPHPEESCTQHRNHHRKYVGLLEHRPRILWIVGPDAFAADPELVYRVDEDSGANIRLRHMDARQLTFSGDLN